MRSALPPAVVRVRVSCGTLEEYRERLEPRYSAHGIFIPSGRIRSRPVGSRVQLKVELGDRTIAYSGGAVVAAQVDAQGRPGFILTLDGAEAPRIPDGVTVELDLPGAAPRPAKGAPSVLARARPDALTEELLRDAQAALSPCACEEVTADAVEPGEPGEPEGATPIPAPLVRRHPVSLRMIPTPVPATLTVTGPLPARPVAGRRSPPARRVAIALAVIAAALATAAGGAALIRAQRRAALVETAFSDAIREADDRLRAGRLALPLGDAALDHLLTARALRPDDGRVTTRLEMVADTFESLARRAVGRGDLEEASAHLAGTLRADPRRDWARAELERVESRRRAQQVRQRHEADKGSGASG
jgi:hypothetical protein